MQNCIRCAEEIPITGAKYCPFCGASQVVKEKPGRRPKTRANGTGTAFKRGSTWTASVVVGWKLPKDPSRPKIPVKKTRGGFTTKKAALNFCSQLMLDTTARRRLTLEECYNEWSEPYEARVGKSTFAGYRSAYNHFKPLHGTYMDAIAITELQKCIDVVPGHRTKQMMKTTAGLLWRHCVAHNLLDKDITGVLYLGKGQSVQREPLTPEEVEKIKKNISKYRYAEYIICLVYLGFRPGEMLELRKDQLHHYIKKDKDGTLTADIWYLVGGKKTAAGKDRIIPIPAQILDYILERAWIPGTDLLFPQYVFSRKTKEKDPELIRFKEMSDEYLNKHVFKPMVQDLGIAEGKVPYCARHSFADMLKEAEGTDKSKAALIGHSDYLFTQEHYQSDTIEELAALVASFE